MENSGLASGSSFSEAALRPIGLVDITVREAASGRVLDKQRRSNNVLNVGRMALLQGLANTAVQPRVYFDRCIVGGGGSYQPEPGGSYIPYDVSRARTGLFGGTALDEVAIVTTCNTDSSGSPYAIVSAVLGSQSQANDQYVNEVALKLKSGDLYALVTWAGLNKTSSIEVVLDWFVYFL